MLRITVLFIIIGLNFSIQGQDLNDFKPLKCRGSVPGDFTQRISDRVGADIDEKIDKSEDNYRDIRSKKEFILESNYLLDDLLMSGQVLFGDEVSEYVSKVADELLKDDPSLRNELRFYVGKSNTVNAFATDQGMIFVTLGLLAQLENEAQLAYILSHEIVHYLNEHTIDSYVDRKREERNLGRKYQSEDELIAQLSNYSRSLEFEADSIGFIRFAQTDYNTAAAHSTFDVLQFSHLPFDEVAFDFSFYESNELSLPLDLKLDTLTGITFDDDYDDSEHSHPAVGKRRAVISRMKSERGGDKGEDFLVSEEEFKRVRDLCRFEGIRLRLRNRSYISTIHNVDILLRDYPENKFLHKSKAKALYLLQAYKKRFKNKDIVTDYHEVEGEISAAYFFFENLSDDDLRILALKSFHNYFDYSDPDDSMTKMYQQLVAGLAEDVDNDLEGLKASIERGMEDSMEEVLEVLVDEEDDIEEVLFDTILDSSMSKYEKLALKQRTEVANSDPKEAELNMSIFRPFLAPLIKDARFVDSFSLAVTSSTEREKEEQASKDKWNDLSAYEVRQLLKKERKAEDKGLDDQITADKIVFVDPGYYIVDEKRGARFTRAEGKAYQLYDQLDDVAARSNVELEVLTPKLSDGFTAEAFNEIAIFKDWYEEEYEHINSSSNWDIVPSEQEYVIRLADQKGTDLFAISGVFMYKEPPTRVGSYIFAGVLLYPLAPYILYEGFSPNYDTYVYNIVYDVTQSKSVIDKVYHISAKGNMGVINSFLYESIMNVNQGQE